MTAGAPAHNAITHTLGTSEPTLAVRVFVKPTAFTPSTQLLSLDNGITVTISNGHWGLVTNRRTAEQMLRDMGLLQSWPALPAAQAPPQRELLQEH